MFTWFDDLYAPRQVMLRPGARGRIGEQVRQWGIGATRAFVVADPVIVALGSLDALIAGLGREGIEAAVFSEIAGEPTDRTIEAAAEAARRAGAELVIGIGGGSALDVAKIVDYLLSTGAPLERVRGSVPPASDYLPLVLVPTTVGTGAEATRIAMYAIDGLKRAVASRQLVPTLAVLDPELIENLPPAVVAATALDSLSHSLESMLSKDANQFTRLTAGEGARLVFANLRDAVVEGDREARSRLLYASYLAGMSLNAGVVLGHSLSYVIASRLGLSHGAGCALALPYCLAYNNTDDPARLARIAEQVSSGEYRDFRRLALDVRALTEEVGLDTSLASRGADEADVPAMVEETIANFPRPNNPVPLERARLTALYGAMYSGDIVRVWDELLEERI